MERLSAVARVDVGIKYRYGVVIANSLQVYRRLDASHDLEHFHQNVISPIADGGIPASGDEVLQRCLGLTEKATQMAFDIALMRIACAYAGEALRTVEYEPMSAIELMTEAYYWLGTLTGVGKLEELRRARQVKDAKEGGNARARKYEPMIAWAHQLVTKNAPWSDRTEAAEFVERKLPAMARRKGWKPLSTKQAKRTIMDWLKEHPLFTERQSDGVKSQ